MSTQYTNNFLNDCLLNETGYVDTFPGLSQPRLYTYVRSYLSGLTNQYTFELVYYLKNDSNTPFTFKLVGLTGDTVYYTLGNSSKLYFDIFDLNSTWQFGFDMAGTVTLKPNETLWIATLQLANWQSSIAEGGYIYGRYFAIQPNGQEGSLVECDTQPIKAPSAVIRPTTLTTYPDLFFPTNTIQLGLKNDSIMNYGGFWDGEFFYHKVRILVDGGPDAWAPELTMTSKNATWQIPIELNEKYALIMNPDEPVLCDFEVETFTKTGVSIGTTWTQTYIQYLPQGAIDPDNNEIIYSGGWETIDDLTYELTEDRYTIIQNLSTVKLTLTGLGYFEGGFKAVVINHDYDGRAVRQEGITNQTEFIFYQCQYPYFQVFVEAAGITTERIIGVGGPGGEGFIYYDKPRITVRTTQLNRNGEMDISIWGEVAHIKFDNGTVNTLKSLKYKYINSEEDSGWITIEPTKKESGSITYSWSAHLTLTPGYNYTFYAQVEDEFHVVETQPIVVMYRPVFDWSQNDFKFNVNTKVDGNLEITGHLLVDAQQPIIYRGRELERATTYDWYVTTNCCSSPTNWSGRFVAIGNMIILNWYITGVVDTTVDKFCIYLDEMEYYWPPRDIHWQSGGGNAAGLKIMLNGHSFCGWNIETVDGRKCIVGRTTSQRSSESDSTLVSNYLGAQAGKTFHASGTIMYYANPSDDVV